MADVKYSEKIFHAIENFFTADDWKFQSNEEIGVIRTGLKLNNKLKSVAITCRVHASDFVMVFTLPIGAGTDTKDLARVNEFLTRANYGMKHGCFEMDFNDGEVDFRVSSFCDEELEPSEIEIKNVLFVGIAMIERYGDAFLKVLYDLSTPEDAINEAES